MATTRAAANHDGTDRDNNDEHELMVCPLCHESITGGWTALLAHTQAERDANATRLWQRWITNTPAIPVEHLSLFIKPSTMTGSSVASMIIDDRVWLGSIDSVRDGAWLDHNGITHVLDLNGRPTPRDKLILQQRSITALHLELNDVSHFDIASYFKQTQTFLDVAYDSTDSGVTTDTKTTVTDDNSSTSGTSSTSGETKTIRTDATNPSTGTTASDHTAAATPSSKQKKQSRILVHCPAGVSRSATILIAWLMHRRIRSSLTDTMLMVRQRRSFVYPNRGFFLALIRYEKELWVNQAPSLPIDAIELHDELPR